MAYLPYLRLYQPLWPYNHYYDNLPIEDLANQLFVVNTQASLTEQALESSIGSAGTLAARLAVALEDNGSLRASAVDGAIVDGTSDTGHNIAMHQDGVDGGGTAYVRMLYNERATLENIVSGSTKLPLNISVYSPVLGTPTPVPVGTGLTIGNSDTITWSLSETNIATANAAYTFWLTGGKIYNATPSGSGTSFTTPSSLPYISGSLRVYINGIRINPIGAAAITIGGSSYTYTEGATNDTRGYYVVTAGDFVLSNSVASNTMLAIDFDRPLDVTS